MKEVKFLQKNGSDWKKFEELLNKDRIYDPDKLADLFLNTMDDLSYARTYYPKSKTTEYLNQLSTKIHGAIYKNKKEESHRIKDFWVRELPEVMFTMRRELIVAFSVFMISVVVGFVSTANDTSYIRLILGDHYVNMTLENIEKGDPMAVYKKANGIDMFLGITWNNVMVSFNAFAMGLMFSFGSAYILFRNGVMLGAFQCFFQQHGLLFEACKTIWIHGTIEISAIVICGAAGMALGNGILFPGTYTRLESFKRGAVRGIKVIVGLVPFFIVAGILESFVTRYSEMPVWLSFTIIIFSLVFMIYYFLVYPLRFRKNLKPSQY